MRVHNFHTKRSLASLGDGMNPRGNTVSVQMLLEGSGAVTATVQPKGRIRPLNPSTVMPLENIGTAISFSGTAPVSQSITIKDLGASELYMDLTSLGSSLMSFSAFGSEAE